jgi:hypothetical protein
MTPDLKSETVSKRQWESPDESPRGQGTWVNQSHIGIQISLGQAILHRPDAG